MGTARLIILLCLAPGAAITIYSLVTAYQAIGAGAEVDSERLRAGVQMGLRWCLYGAGVALGLLLLQIIYRLLRPRRRRTE